MRPTRYRYGELRSQVGDLWLPAGTGSGADGAPVVVLIHGGYWRSMYTKAIMNRLARAMASRGWAAWNIEYRRTGPLGGGGGWPTTLADVAAALDYVTCLTDVDATRVITCGHSAGGCLALWVAARSRVDANSSVNARDVQPLAAVSLAGVVDLRRGAELGLGSSAVVRFMGGGFDDHPDRYRSSSPAALLPLGVRQVLVHGLSDTVVPPSMSSDYQRSAREAGDDAIYVPVEGVNHRGMIDPTSAAWPVISSHIERFFST